MKLAGKLSHFCDHVFLRNGSQATVAKLQGNCHIFATIIETCKNRSREYLVSETRGAPLKDINQLSEKQFKKLINIFKKMVGNKIVGDEVNRLRD